MVTGDVGFLPVRHVLERRAHDQARLRLLPLQSVHRYAKHSHGGAFLRDKAGKRRPRRLPLHEDGIEGVVLGRVAHVGTRRGEVLRTAVDPGTRAIDGLSIDP